MAVKTKTKSPAVKQASKPAQAKSAAKPSVKPAAKPASAASSAVSSAARSTVRYMRVAPRKARLVVDMIRGKKVDAAISILSFAEKAVSRDIAKVLKSAIANAENTKKLDVDKLYVTRAFVDPAPVMKRTYSKAMGRGSVIRKRSSHVTIEVDQK